MQRTQIDFNRGFLGLGRRSWRQGVDFIFPIIHDEENKSLHTCAGKPFVEFLIDLRYPWRYSHKPEARFQAFMDVLEMGWSQEAEIIYHCSLVKRLKAYHVLYVHAPRVPDIFKVPQMTGHILIPGTPAERSQVFSNGLALVLEELIASPPQQVTKAA